MKIPTCSLAFPALSPVWLACSALWQSVREGNMQAIDVNQEFKTTSLTYIFLSVLWLKIEVWKPKMGIQNPETHLWPYIFQSMRCKYDSYTCTFWRGKIEENWHQCNTWHHTTTFQGSAFYLYNSVIYHNYIKHNTFSGNFFLIAQLCYFEQLYRNMYQGNTFSGNFFLFTQLCYFEQLYINMYKRNTF